MHVLQKLVQKRLTPLGITINGPNDWDPQIDEKDIGKVLLRGLLLGSVGVGDAYRAGLWKTRKEAALEEFFVRIFSRYSPARSRGLSDTAHRLWSSMHNRQRGREKEVGESHYDKFSAVHEEVLGPTGQYSCGYLGDGAQTLDEAQIAKMHRIALKLKLRPGMRVADIGCGWGGLARYLAAEYQVTVVGLTVSDRQAAKARENRENPSVLILCMPFKDLPEGYNGTFDRIVSVGMFEHVGPDNYDAFFKKARSLLKPDGLMLLHSIVSFRTNKYGNAWINKRIFINGVLPSEEQMVRAYTPYFRMRHKEDFGLDYAPTLRWWYQRFAAIRESVVQRFGPEFYHETVFYLLSCVAKVVVGDMMLHQVVLTPRGVPPIEYRWP